MPVADRIRLEGRLPVGAIDTRASGWWAMIFTVFTEASLFAYLLFSYFYLAVQPHLPGTFPQGGAPDMTLALPNTIILLLSSVAVGWAQLGIEHGSKARLTVGLGVGAALGLAFLVVQYFEWAQKPFTLASSTYSSLYFTVTGFHMAHVVVGVVMLLALTCWSSRGYFNKVRYAHIHIGALYWHFVDAVWLVVFFTFYITPLLGLKA
jgi:cytochrome c oxidase subunit 3